MLEVLPPGASKGKGVEILLAHLGIDPVRLLALGEQTSNSSSCRLQSSLSQTLFREGTSSWFVSEKKKSACDNRTDQAMRVNVAHVCTIPRQTLPWLTHLYITHKIESYSMNDEGGHQLLAGCMYIYLCAPRCTSVSF